MLDKNDGDVGTTIEQLMMLISKQGQEESEKRNKLVEAIIVRLGSNENETRSALEKYNWDQEKAIQDLTQQSTKKKFDLYVGLYMDLEPSDIEAVIELSDKEILNKLDALRARIHEEMKRKIAEEEEKKRLEELRREEERERELKFMREEEKRIAEEKKKIEEQRKIQEQERIAKLEKQEREAAEAKRRNDERLRKEEEERLQKIEEERKLREEQLKIEAEKKETNGALKEEYRVQLQ